ncbi:MAG TPA: hypothetical protein VIK74_07180 [Parasegetibacter sp.]
MNSTSRYKWLVFIIGVLLVTNIAMLAMLVKKKDPPKRENRSGQTQTYQSRTVMILEKEVGFSKEQLEQYQALREDHSTKMRPIIEKIRASKDSFYRLLSLPEISDSLLQATAAKVAEAENQVNLQTFQHFRDIKALCTPEQQPKFEKFIENVISRMVVPVRRTAQQKKEDSLRQVNQSKNINTQ